MIIVFQRIQIYLLAPDILRERESLVYLGLPTCCANQSSYHVHKISQTKLQRRGDSFLK